MRWDDCPFVDLPPGAHCQAFEIPLGAEAPLTISVRIIRGAAAGPVLMAMAGEHGNELNGVAAVELALCRIDWQKLRGTVIGIPVLNPRNVAARNHCHLSERGKPYGRKDPYNTAFAWPGCADGSPAERITSHLLSHVLPQPDIFVNLHWHVALVASAIICMKPGELAPLFASQGACAFVVELSGQWWLNRHVIERGAKGILNLLRCSNMLAGAIETQDEQYLLHLNREQEEHIVRSPGDGLFIPAIDHEKQVRAGDLLGWLLDVHTLDRAEITSPADGAIWFAAHFGLAPDTTLEGMHAFASTGDMVAIVKPTIKVVRNGERPGISS